MSFDFEAAERDMADVGDASLRARAVAAFEILQADARCRLLTATHQILDEILGVSAYEAKEPEVNINPSGYGNVEVIVYNIRFKVEVSPRSDDEEDEVTLKMYTFPTRAWAPITSLNDVGRILSRDPCYAVQPEMDGRGSE